MSEYQIVMFRAIDRPLTDKQLEFMDRQSSRAEFTRWQFAVEYHYSSFRGDIEGMLRNGYDIFLNYTNYGEREIRIRLPNGLPFPKNVWPKYFDRDKHDWTADKSGKGGSLRISQCLENAESGPEDFDQCLDAAAKLREVLIAGDLRGLYLVWLCGSSNVYEEDGAELEPPVPHGLGELPEPAQAILNFFDIDSLLLDAAAAGIPAFDPQAGRTEAVNFWLDSIAEPRRADLIRRLVSEDPAALKEELLEEIRGSNQSATWPVSPPTRSINQLFEKCELLRQREDEKERQLAVAKEKREAAKVEKARQARMVEMKSAPGPWLEKASKLVEGRGKENYCEAAQLIAEIREVLGGNEGERIARKHAAHLVQKYPTLQLLRSSLKKQGLLS
jgi:hypothetical protein